MPTGGALPKASSTSHVGGTPAPPSTAPTVAATAHTPNPGAAPPHISAGGNAGVSVSASAAQPEQPRRRQHQFWRLDAELMIDGFSAAPIKDATLVFAVGSRRGTGAISYAGPRASAPPVRRARAPCSRLKLLHRLTPATTLRSRRRNKATPCTSKSAC